MLWYLPLPGKTGLKDTGNPATGSLKKEVWKNVSSPQSCQLPFLEVSRDFFAFWLVFLILQGPVLSSALPKKLSWVTTDCLTFPWLLLLPTSWAGLYFKNLSGHSPVMTITFDIALLCAKDCAECFAIITPSNPHHKASTVTSIL